jgi:hypothetical protein
MIKRTIFTIFFTLFLSATAHAAGNVITEAYDKGHNFKILVFTCIGDETDGSIPNTSVSNLVNSKDESWSALKYIEGSRLRKIIIENDSSDTSVTDNADVYILDEGGSDLLNGVGEDQLDDDTRNVPFLVSYEPIIGEIILQVDNQNTAGGEFTITLIFSR